MVSIQLIGDWPPGALVTRFVASSFAPPQAVQEKIEQAWLAARQRLGDRLFDGPMCRLESIRQQGQQGSSLYLELSRISYKPFLGTNLTSAELADEFGASAMANPVGLSCALVSSDGFLLMGRRNRFVAYYPERIHPFAGALEPADPMDIFDEVRRELREELALGGDDLSDLRCIGLVQDLSLRQPELVFVARSMLSRSAIESRLDSTEHHATWSVPSEPEAALDALRDIDLLTPVGVGTILLWGRRTFGDDWLEKARALVPSVQFQPTAVRSAVSDTL